MRCLSDSARIHRGQKQLYQFAVLRDRQTFGSSGFPLCSPPARKEWRYPDGLCPVSEEICANTLCLHWSEKFEPAHVEQISTALLKVLRAYAS